MVGADGESVPLSRPVHRSPDPARKDQPGVDDIFVVALTSALRRSELEEPAGWRLLLLVNCRACPRLRLRKFCAAPKPSRCRFGGYADNAGSMTRRLLTWSQPMAEPSVPSTIATAGSRTLVLSRITGAVLAADIAKC